MYLKSLILNFIVATSLKVTMLTSDLSKKSLNEEKKIIIIRHGRTEMNEQLAIQEWGSDNFVDKRLFDTILTVTGIRQAQALNKEIISKSLGEIDLLISSPLSRTLHTAELSFKGKFCFHARMFSAWLSLQNINYKLILISDSKPC